MFDKSKYSKNILDSPFCKKGLQSYKKMLETFSDAKLITVEENEEKE